jgi:glycosyltransferase involved in cell wall biosynthesis
MLAYNVFSAISIPTLLAAWITGSTPVALIADTPHDQYAFRGAKGLLERLDFFLQTRIIKRFSGIICLTRQTWHDFASERPGLVVEGGVNPSEVTEAVRETSFTSSTEQHPARICMYSGELSILNGIPMLLKGFSMVADPDLRLWFLGRGECERAVMDAARQDPRISFLGFRPNDEVRALQKEATILVNPRPSQQQVSKYTFPSKLMEYMQSGTPVLTTRLPGIPADYYQHVFSIETETTEGIAAALRESLSLSVADLEEKGKCAKDFVMKYKSWQAQARRIAHFLRTITEDSHLSPEISRQ